MLYIIKMLPKYPYAALICGKTEFVLDLLSLLLEKDGYLKYFEYIVIICPTIAENLAYEKRKWIWDDERVYIDNLPDSTLHETIEIYHEIFKGDETLFIIDYCRVISDQRVKVYKTRKR